MNIIICDDRIDDRKNLLDLLSDYGEKKNYEFDITEYDSGEQVILSDKGNRETEQIINIGKVIIFWNRDGRMFYVKDYR